MKYILHYLLHNAVAWSGWFFVEAADFVDSEYFTGPLYSFGCVLYRLAYDKIGNPIE